VGGWVGGEVVFWNSELLLGSQQSLCCTIFFFRFDLSNFIAESFCS